MLTGPGCVGGAFGGTTAALVAVGEVSGFLDGDEEVVAVGGGAAALFGDLVSVLGLLVGVVACLWLTTSGGLALDRGFEGAALGLAAAI